MKKSRIAVAAAMVSMFLVNAPAHAWGQETHRRIVLDAVQFMKNNPGQTNYTKLLAGVTRAGYTMDQFAAALGQGAYDVDDFVDTYICGATTGNCQYAPVWGAGASIVKYTSYWHFQNHTAGPDVHGNPFGGYNYAKLSVAGDIDKLAATWLVGDYLDDGAGGLKGWFGDSSKYNSFGLTEAHYRFSGYSTAKQYADFETMPFQPIDNLGQYWFGQFLSSPTAQSLGFVLHTTDLLQPHHTWTTSANNHSGWETWVGDYYYSAVLNDPTLVKAALADFTPLAPGALDIRPLLTQGGTYSYANGGIVLTSTDQNDRVRIGKLMIPHAIAMVVHVLNRAAERLAN
ncbi:MAG TPA: phospholipase [Janthinobacterium sp.]|nr:phospholipase [Janthinobacterium sp.]